ncbi:MAG: substrate-binding domain-containing protein [Acetobacteraceae bacterium]|nr:substrate-binding domain-containing protein [Acetobacteraceae bacterium]
MRVLSTMGVHGVMQAFGPEFEAAQGVTLAAEFMPTARLLERIRAGERADVAILTAEGIDALVAEGVLAGRTNLARSFIGVAVKAGAPHPDITSPEAFVATLLAASSVAMSKAGVSGLYMAGLLERLGIAAAVRAKATILDSGYTASLAASGAAELAIQQVSELMVVDGIEIVGRLPAVLGGESVFSAGLFLEASQDGQPLIDALADPARIPLYRRCGLEPIGVLPAMQA